MEFKLAALRLSSLKKELAINHRCGKSGLFSDESGVGLRELLDKNKFNINFSKEISAFLMMYFLSEFAIVNEEGVHAGINYKKIKKRLGFSKTLS